MTPPRRPGRAVARRRRGVSRGPLVPSVAAVGLAAATPLGWVAMLATVAGSLAIGGGVTDAAAGAQQGDERFKEWTERFK